MRARTTAAPTRSVQESSSTQEISDAKDLPGRYSPAPSCVRNGAVGEPGTCERVHLFARLFAHRQLSDAYSLLVAGRFGSYQGRVGFEGSITYSAKALKLGLFDGALTSDARAVFGEFNVLVNILQGSFQPFVTAGLGAHVYELTDIKGDPAVKFGYNFGAGLRYVSGKFVFRGDVRDHVTSLEISDFGLGLEDVIAGAGSGTVHNIEFSVGIGVIF